MVKSLEAALWAFYKSDTFEKGCLLSVNLGEDADTTGAIYGQMTGTYYGKSGITPKWINSLKKLDLIELSYRLFELLSGNEFPALISSINYLIIINETTRLV